MCALAKTKGHSFNCYTIDTGGGPDLEAAKEVSRYLNLPLRLVKVTDLDIENAFPKIVKSLGTFQSELILGGLFTYFISREAYGDGLKVLLFGEGADEVFGGYNKYQLALEESSENADKMMLTDLNTLWLTHNRRVDHASMAASIEARVPYQDAYIINNARKLPLEMKVDKGNLLKDKIALRNIAKKYLPYNIATRKKEVISRGTDLGFMLNKVSRKMASYYHVESISDSERKDFNIESYIEAVAFKIWRKIFPNLAENIISMRKRGLLKKISI